MWRRLRRYVLGTMAILAFFAALQYFAIRSLRTENRQLREDLKAAQERLQEVVIKEITEHRTDERDRYFQLRQDIQLEATRTRTTVKETCP